MHATVATERTLTELDYLRLQKLVGRNAPAAVAAVLDAADTVQSCDIAADVVTMHSQVELRDLHTARRQTLTLCYPSDAGSIAGCVSVLSPVGASLLGLKVGSVARWQTPSGEQGEAEVVAIPFQPEASGDYTA